MGHSFVVPVICTPLCVYPDLGPALVALACPCNPGAREDLCLVHSDDCANDLLSNFRSVNQDVNDIGI